MKTVKKLNRQHILLITLGAVLLVFVVAGIILNAVIAPIVEANNNANNETTPSQQIELLGEETLYAGQPVAFPRITEASIEYIFITNKTGSYDLTRYPEITGSFWVGYKDGEGVQNMVQYIPPIVDAEGDYSYEDLYAETQSGGYFSGYMITYLCVAIGTMYFSERMELPEDETEREAMLSEFGLDDGNVQQIAFTYRVAKTEVDENGNTVQVYEKDENGEYKTDSSGKKIPVYENLTRYLAVGGQPISGKGFYYMVDNRDYIYYTESDYLQYALYGVESYIKGNLIGPGLDSDGAYEPYLTTGFQQWKNTMHKQTGSIVLEDCIVICTGQAITPTNRDKDYTPPEGAPSNGYTYSGLQSLTFDLQTELASHPDYERFKKILEGQQIKVYFDPLDTSMSEDDRLFVTILDALSSDNEKRIDFGEEDSLTYTYIIHEIEAVITETEEITEAGAPVSGAKLVKVAYNYEVGGERMNSLPHHAVIDLSSDRTLELLPDEAEALITASSVGVLENAISFDVTYTEKNSLVAEESIVVSAISGIYDEKGESIDKVTADSYVTFNYYEVLEGIDSAVYTRTVYMKDMDEDERWQGLRDALMGKSRGEQNIVAYRNTYSYELMRPFVCYAVHSINQFVSSELVTSFRFVNASERDPFYGEIYYENLMTEGESLYGLNASSCENVVRFLGGVDSGGTVSSGISGETVALGLTPEVMDEYGLYAHKIYFELPRGITDMSEANGEGSDDELSDYAWFGTLGFTLYISDVVYEADGSAIRYIGSDMFDLVAKVDASDFEFIDYTFTEFWARKNLVLIKIDNLDTLTFDFKLEDVYGEYMFDIYNTKAYSDGNRLSNRYFEGSTEVDVPNVSIFHYGDVMDSVYKDYCDEAGVRYYDIGDLYDKLHYGGEKTFVPGTTDTIGTENFKKAFELLQLTRYENALTDTDKELLYDDSGKITEHESLLTMTLKLNGRDTYYIYDFYRFSDTKVAVAIHTEDRSGNPTSEVGCEFYVTTFAFKKLVVNFAGLLNGEILDTDAGYPDYGAEN